MITGFTSILGDAGLNIAEMANKSRGDVAYTMVDLDSAADAITVAKLCGLDGVYRVRVIK